MENYGSGISMVCGPSPCAMRLVDPDKNNTWGINSYIVDGPGPGLKRHITMKLKLQFLTHVPESQQLTKHRHVTNLREARQCL